ncbi:MAG: pantetheine-phosphate adenylyltransferase [Nitrospinae bacterium]|nr:pantetheine-phosphate adenylyltransferase [Nitrospinota bacterium]
MGRTAVYPGTFDPITNGHIDLIQRGLCIFDEVIVAVSNNPDKRPLFSLEERKGFIQEATRGLGEIRIDSFNSLLIQYAKEIKVNVIIRGLRAVSDFEYEYQMALMNRKLDSSIETVFMMPSEKYSFISSRLIKEVVSFGGCVKGMVPDIVEEALRGKFKKPSQEREAKALR